MLSILAKDLVKAICLLLDLENKGPSGILESELHTTVRNLMVFAFWRTQAYKMESPSL